MASGSQLFRVEAVDPNQGDTLTYRITSGNDAGTFVIDQTTGVVSLAAGSRLDYETSPSYALTVEVIDQGGLSTTSNITLSVKNLDEAAPTITSGASASINENVAADSIVYTARSTDTADISSGVTYSLKSNGDASAFTINSATGVVRIKSSPDFEGKSEYSFTVVATDGAGNSSEQPVSLSIKDVNEAPTVLSLANATTTLAENTDTTSRVKVADIVVTDDAVGTSTFRLTGTDAALFEVLDGGLYLKAGVALDFETKSKLDVRVEIFDNTLAGECRIKGRLLSRRGRWSMTRRP